MLKVHIWLFQMKCCGIAGFHDYNNTALNWYPRATGALAPSTCCKHTSSDKLGLDGSVDPISTCYSQGNIVSEYNQQVTCSVYALHTFHLHVSFVNCALRLNWRILDWQAASLFSEWGVGVDWCFPIPRTRWKYWYTECVICGTF